MAFLFLLLLLTSLAFPGIIALKSNDKAKVAKFLDNLQARHLTVDQLPTCLREELAKF